MNKFLSNKYAFLGKEQKANTALTNKMRGALKNSTWQFLIFGALICVIGYLAVNKVSQVSQPHWHIQSQQSVSVC